MAEVPKIEKNQFEAEILPEKPLANLFSLSTDLSLGLKAEVPGESFERFAFSVNAKELLNNESLKKEFLALEKEDLNLERGRDYQIRIKKFSEKIENAGIKEFKNLYGSHIFLERRRIVSRRIINSIDSDSGKVFVKELEFLNVRRQKKEISDEEYFARVDNVYDQAIDRSNDGELKSKWVKYKNEEVNSSFNFDAVAAVSPSGNVDEKPIEVKTEVDLAVSKARDLGMQVDTYHNNVAKVHFPDFSVDVSLFENEKTHELVYYLNDDFAAAPKVVKSEDFLDALDQRHLDMFVSDKIGLNLRGADSVLEIADDQIVKLGEKLIGKGVDRNYHIEGRDREVLEAVAKVLIRPDVKYLTLAKKIEALNDFLDTDDRLFAVKRRLVGAGSVGELMGN